MGTLVRIDQLANIDPSTSHSLDAVIDRIGIHPSQRDRVASSVNTALDLGKGLIVVYDPENEEEELFSEFAYSKRSGKSYPPLQPHDFSFNHPSGMCPECEGRGETREFVLDRIIDENKTLREGFCVVAGSYDAGLVPQCVRQSCLPLWILSRHAMEKALTKGKKRSALWD